MTSITFEQLPQAVQILTAEIQKLRKELQDKLHPQQQSEQYFTLEELCHYLPQKPAKATIYAKVHCKEIPYKKRGKKLYFLKSEIDFWLNQTK